MRRELRDKWEAALRSGRYKQGMGQLRSEAGRYCCIGVLCDVVDPTGWSRYQGIFTNRGFYTHPLSTAGLGVDGSSLMELRFPWRLHALLVNMNDLKGRKFSEIADVIAAQMPIDENNDPILGLASV